MLLQLQGRKGSGVAVPGPAGCRTAVSTAAVLSVFVAVVLPHQTDPQEFQPELFGLSALGCSFNAFCPTPEPVGTCSDLLS